MLVKTPLKKKETSKNRRRSSPKKQQPEDENKNHGRRKKHRKGFFSLPQVAPWKIILCVIVLGLLGILYLKNVFATQKLLTKVQHAQQQYNLARRNYDNYRLKYDRMIGPSAIYKKAKARGFINGGPAEKVITVDKDE